MKNDCNAFVVPFLWSAGRLKKALLVKMLFLSFSISAQSDLDRILKGGELVIGGLSIFKILSSDPEPPKKEVRKAQLTDDIPKPSKVVSSFCVKNGLSDKILLQLTKKEENGTIIEKELIIQHDNHECLFDLPKGIWIYQILLSETEEVYKKGEYKLVDDEVVIIIKEE